MNDNEWFGFGIHCINIAITENSERLWAINQTKTKTTQLVRKTNYFYPEGNNYGEKNENINRISENFHSYIIPASTGIWYDTISSTFTSVTVQNWISPYTYFY